jgi:transketolase
VEHSTGSLGHGLSVGVGHAVAQRSKNSSSRTYVICGDGEIQEGSCWEALMLASTLKLNNLSVFIDYNKISSITHTESVIHTGELWKRFHGMGLEVFEVDGHRIDEIKKAISKSMGATTASVIICHTVKGKGFSLAENDPLWHYKTLDDKLLKSALKELEG